MIKKEQAPIVKEVNPETVQGNTALERELNAFLTKNFIMSGDVPADECIDEARDIIEGEFTRGLLISYLRHQFGITVQDAKVEKTADNIIQIINKFKEPCAM